MAGRGLLIKFYLWLLLALVFTVAVVVAALGFVSYRDYQGRLSRHVLEDVSPLRDMAQQLMARGLSPREVGALLAPLAEAERASVTIVGPHGQPLYRYRYAGTEDDDGADDDRDADVPAAVREEPEAHGDDEAGEPDEERDDGSTDDRPRTAPRPGPGGMPGMPGMRGMRGMPGMPGMSGMPGMMGGAHGHPGGPPPAHVDMMGRGRLVVTLPLELEQGQVGRLSVVTHGRRWHEERLPQWLLASLGGVLVLVLVLSWPLAAHLARPLRQLSGAAEALGRGDLTARVRVRRRDEIGRLADTFNRMGERLQGMMHAHKQLLADISHELRTPLARLRVALALARQDGGPAVAPNLDRIESQADALELLVQELLDYARLDALPAAGERTPVAPGDVARETVEAAALDAEAAGVHLALQVAPDAPAVRADRTLLARALGNVVRNAITHAPPESTVRVSVTAAAPRVRFTVHDAGAGVAPDMLERIFEPFVRAEAARDRTSGGVGLGLALARRCMQAHGGDAHAENDPAGGFIVTLWLPAAGEPA